MCTQLDLEVICKRPKNVEDHSIFINFRVKKVHNKKHSIKRKL